MENHLAGTVLFIDAILFAATISFSILMVIYVLIKQAAERRRHSNIRRIISSLQKLTVDGKGFIMDGCVDLIKRASPDEFLGLTRRGEEKIFPKKFSGEFTKCINISGKIAQIEQLAERSNNKWRRIEAILTIGYLNTPNALKILKVTLLERDEDVAYFSMLALGHIKSSESVKALLGAIKSRVFSGYKVASILETFPPDIAPELILATQDPDPVLRFWAIKLLSRSKGKQYADEISKLTGDELPDIRAAACEGLGDIGQESTRKAVKVCLNDPEWFVRIHAARALEKIFGADSVPELVGFLEDDNWFVQESIKKVLMKHIERALPHIEKLLESGSQSVKKVCFEILDRSGYTDRILRDSVSENNEARAKASRLLKAMLDAGAHFGLEGFLRTYPHELYSKVLNAISAIDKEKAEHIDKKIRGDIVEV